LSEIYTRSLHDALPICVAREVGTEGKLGGQAKVKGGGVWKDLTDSVNQMGSNLTAQVRNIAEVTTAILRTCAVRLLPIWLTESVDRKSTRLNSSHVKSS